MFLGLAFRVQAGDAQDFGKRKWVDRCIDDWLNKELPSGSEVDPEVE